MTTPENPQSYATVMAVAEGENLGRLKASYSPQRMEWWRLTIMLLFGIVFLVFLLGLYFLWLAFNTPNFSGRQAAKRLYFFERGLIVADVNGPTAVYRWENLTCLQAITNRYAYGVKVATTYVYTLITPDGKTAKITNFFAKPDEWGPAIQNEITRAQIPGIMAALQGGANVEFGSLVINRGGLSTGSRSLRWDEVQAVQIQQGYLQIKRANGWLRWSAKPVSQIPNFFVFLTAVNQLRQTYPAAT
jgi:hypothetical protein